MHPKTIKVSFVIVIVILILVGLFYSTKLSCHTYSCLEFPEKNLWKVSDTFESNKSLWRGVVKHPDYLIRLYKVGGVKPENAEEYTKINLMNIKGLFDTAKSPYAGVISDKITCSEELQPKESVFENKFGIKVNYMISYLNDRFQYGACTESQIKYKVFNGTFYCKNVNEWYQIEVIVDKDKASDESVYEDLFINANCHRPSVNTGKLLP